RRARDAAGVCGRAPRRRLPRHRVHRFPRLGVRRGKPRALLGARARAHAPGPPAAGSPRARAAHDPRGGAVSEPRAIVAGGGPVGLALACALRGFDVHVIEPATPQVPGEALDLRVLALSPGTRELLRDLGAWERIDGARLAAVKRMEIFGDAGARLAFSSRPGAALAWIVEASRLAFALREQAVSMGITVHAQRAKAYGAQASGAWAELEDGARIEGEILVGADGPDSQVRGATAIASEERPYPEAAIVAHFETGEPHGGVARQWFRDDGVLAWLPLPGKRISIVWSAPSHHADAFMAEAGADFERRVRDAGQAAL